MKMSNKDFNNLKINGVKKTTPRTYYNRLNEAIKTGFCFKSDKAYNTGEAIIFEFINVYLLSHNDILRIHYKKMYPYIKLWKERVKHISKEINIEELNKSEDYKLKIEILYITKNSNFLDYDSTIAASKYIIDGLTESNIIEDDSIEFIPIILSKQDKNKEENAIKIVITPITQEEYESYYSKEFKKMF
jgi:hypothetical protein